MKKRFFIVVAVVAVAALALAGTSSASSTSVHLSAPRQMVQRGPELVPAHAWHPTALNLQRDMHPLGGAIIDGPYTSISPDSNACGNAWAIDVYNRSFAIYPQNPDGSWTVIQTFQKARFQTLGDGQTGAAPSPGSCDLPGDAGHTTMEGLVGKFGGSFTILIQPGYNYTGIGGCNLTNWGSMVPSWGSGGSDTPGDCASSADWVAVHFVGAENTYGIPAFSLKYKAKVPGHGNETYTQADTGESGDIYSAP